ncbi:unnamed protein product [Closterium sp. Naga37s-1]|nr:unnamed protein product [Closterium sp. Naga37s-1]
MGGVFGRPKQHRGDGKVVAITGCSKGGIGYALAEEYARRGAKVFATARSVEAMDGLQEQGVSTVKLDVTKEDDIKSAVDVIVKSAGQIDILVNNAGVLIMGPVADLPLSSWRHGFETNLLGAVAMAQAVFPHMAERRSGCIVNISSILGYQALPTGAVYAASKAALTAATDCMRMEMKNPTRSTAGPWALCCVFGIQDGVDRSNQLHAHGDEVIPLVPALPPVPNAPRQPYGRCAVYSAFKAVLTAATSCMRMETRHLYWPMGAGYSASKAALTAATNCTRMKMKHSPLPLHHSPLNCAPRTLITCSITGPWARCIRPMGAVYSASKAALTAANNCMRMEMKPSPFPFPTLSFSHTRPSLRAQSQAHGRCVFCIQGCADGSE